MKISRQLLTFATIALAARAWRAISSPSCDRLTDENSTFASFVKSFAGDDDGVNNLFSVFKSLDTTYPWLSKCIASINPMTTYKAVEMSSGYKSCNATISKFSMPESLTDSAIRDKVCPFVGDTLIPCINNVAVQAILDAMAGSGGCCDDLQNEIKINFGSELKSVVADLLSRAGAVACTVKTFTNSAGKATSESCLYSIITGLFDDRNFNGYLETFFQIPTDQVCKAVNGKSFTTTMNSAAQFKWTSFDVQNLGICYEPLSALFKTVGSYPVMASTNIVRGTKVSLADVFTTGKCLGTEAASQWMMDKSSLPMALAQLVDDALTAASDTIPGLKTEETENATTAVESFAENLKSGQSFCLHLASGQSCDYGGATVALTYKPTTTTTTKSSKSASGELLQLTLPISAAISIVMILNS